MKLKSFITGIYDQNTQDTFFKTFDTFDTVRALTGNITLSNYKEETQYMENLYSVVVVNEYREIIIDEKVVAKNEESAKFNSGVYNVVSESGLTLDDVTVIVTKLGSVKVDKDIQ